MARNTGKSSMQQFIEQRQMEEEWRRKHYISSTLSSAALAVSETAEAVYLGAQIITSNLRSSRMEAWADEVQALQELELQQ